MSFGNVSPMRFCALATRQWLVRGWAVFTSLSLTGLTVASAGIPNYVSRSWQSEHGLPASDVTTILQTRDGYLWIGTYNGLARFDGMRFTVFQNQNTPAMQSPVVTALYEATNEVLWVGYINGDVTTYHHGRFTRMTDKRPWSAAAISGIGADEAGEIWILSEPGQIVRVRDNLILTAEPGPGPRWAGLASCSDGTLFVLRNGRVSRLVKDRLEVLAPLSSPGFVQGIAPSRDGGIWLMCDGRLRKWNHGQWSNDLGPAPWGYGRTPQFIESGGGWLEAAVYDHGFVRWRPGKEDQLVRFDRAHRFESDWVTALLEDREGNLWVGTGGAGICMVRPSPVQAFSPPDRWQGREVSSVSPASDGGLWVGTGGAGLYHFKDGAWTNYSIEAGLGNPYIWSAMEDSRSNLWVASWGAGLFRKEGERFQPAPGLGNVTVPMTALYRADDGEIWVGTEDGLMRYHDGRAAWVTLPSDMVERSVRSIVQDTNGSFWFGVGMLRGGLARLKGEGLQLFHKQDGMAGDFVSCLRLDGDGTLWIAISGGGVTRLKNGRFSMVDREHGLANNFICDIEEDDQGYFWMSSHYGIFRVYRSELDRCAAGDLKRVSCLVFGVEEGLPTLECAGGMQPAGCKTADGRIWFPTTRGLVAIDPTQVNLNPLAPNVIIEEVRVDGKLLAGDNSGPGPLRIPPGRHQLDFRCTALSLAVPEKVRFKYRLDGLHSDWVDAGAQRTFTYTFIPPGHYRFHVTACNNDGVWNDTGAVFGFAVLPYFWQTVWFRVLSGSAAIGLTGGGVWLGMRGRLRRKLERIERVRVVERERARIAKDIHDDLGASLTRITLLSQSARSDLENPELAAAGLDRIYETARDLTRAMDEIVWAVNPRHDTLDSLASYLSKYAQDYVRAAKIRCSFSVPTHLPSWPVRSELRHNLFLALKEALHNVVRHSSATEVHLDLTLGDGGFSLCVEDNGRGYDSTKDLVAAAGPFDRPGRGNGLPNMQRRLSEVGGKFEISRLPAGGTRVVLRVQLGSHVSDTGAGSAGERSPENSV